MVPVSKSRPCLLLKCLFRIHTTESGLRPETQTSTHPVHSSSTHWLQLIDTPPPTPPHPPFPNTSPLSSDLAQLSKQTSLLSSQAGAQRWSVWTAGGALACSWRTVFNNAGTLVNPQACFNDIFITPSLWTRNTWVKLQASVQVQILLSSAYQEEIHPNSTVQEEERDHPQ